MQKLIAGPCSKDELVELVPQFRQIPYNYVTNLVRCRLENILHDQYFSQKTALEEPELLNVTAECVMNMTEKAILSKYMQFQNNIEEDLDEDIWDSQALYDSIMSVHLIFVELAVNSDQNDTRPGPVGQEIIRMYKERIFRLRLQIPKIFIEASDQLCRFIYYDKY